MPRIDAKVASLTHSVLDAEIREYQALLDAKSAEQQVHDFLAGRSYFFNGELRMFGASPLYSKVRLGSDFEVDFAWFDTGSSGAEWRFVEIEAPSRPMFTKSGQPSSWLNHALQQVRDWHTWIHENLDYARKLMPYVEYPLAYVVVGRRSDLTSTSAKRLKRLCYEHRQYAQIHTLDWLTDLAGSAHNLISDAGGCWPIPARAFSHADLRQQKPDFAFQWLHSPYPKEMATEGLQERLDDREYAHEHNEDVRAIIGPSLDELLSEIPEEGDLSTDRS